MRPANHSEMAARASRLFSNPSGSEPKKNGGPPEGDRRGVSVVTNVTSITGETTLIRKAPAKTFPARPAIAFVGTVEMTPKEWAAVLDNPRQRDTEAHARRADHLKVPHPAHCKVNMAALPDGRQYKLDGHTRSFIWERGDVASPKTLYVDVWECASVETAKELYSTFDSRGAVETVSDQVFGAKRDQGVAFTSSMLAGGKFAAGMRFAYDFLYGGEASREISVYELLKVWRRELALLDQCGPTPRRFHVGVCAAALLTFKRYGADATEFWTLFANGAGTKGNGLQDAVQALEDRMEKRRADHLLGGRANITEIVGIVISAFERFRRGENYISEKGGVTGNGRGSGIKTTTGNAFREWMIAAKHSKRAA